MKKIFIGSLLLLSLSVCFTTYTFKSTPCLSTIASIDENLSIIQDYASKAGYTCDVFFLDEITIPDSNMYPQELRRQTLKVYDLAEPTYDGEFYFNESTGNVYEYINDVWICHSNNMTVISPGYINFKEYSLDDLDTLKEDGIKCIDKYLLNKNIEFLSFDYFNDGSTYPEPLKYKSVLRYRVSDSLSYSYVFYNPETNDVFEEVNDELIWHNMYRTLK